MSANSHQSSSSSSNESSSSSNESSSSSSSNKSSSSEKKSNNENVGQVHYKQADWLSDKEKQVVSLINSARRKPVEFSKKIMSPLKGTHFKKQGSIWHPDYDMTDMYMPIATLERLDGYEKAIEYVKSQPKLKAIKVSKGLSLACQDHVADQSQSGEKGHIGDDGSVFRDRAERYGKTTGKILKEVLIYGHDGAIETLCYAIWNDGNKTRADRNAIFNPDNLVIGIAHGSHASWGACCVMFLSDGYEEDPEKQKKRDSSIDTHYQTARDNSYLVRKGNQAGCCTIS